MDLSSLFKLEFHNRNNPDKFFISSTQNSHCEWHHKSTINKKIVTIYVIQCQNCQTDPKEKPPTSSIKKSSHNIHTRGTLWKLSPPIPNYNLLSRHFNFFFMFCCYFLPRKYIISLQGRLSSVNKMEFPHEVSIPSYIIIIPFNNIKI